MSCNKTGHSHEIVSITNLYHLILNIIILSNVIYE